MFTYLLDHPIEVQELQAAKEAKRKEKEVKDQEKSSRKKQKEEQKLLHPHFTDFKKINAISLENG
jgi:hypothetical protein